jgi:KipI family sensor histidine kinase inhibitor
MIATDNMPRLLDAGDCGLVVEFGDTIDEATNARVLQLDAALTEARLDGVRETVPTYRSLLILFDPIRLRRRALHEAVLRMLPHLDADGPASSIRRWRIPVLYGGASGEDLETVAALHGLTTDDVIDLHAGADYRVYMIGFMPGFAYLGGLPDAIHTSRRTNPRQKTPPRSISIGGRQAAVSPPIEVPSGWHLLGQTPVHVYDPRRAEQPFLLKSGDRVRFERIGQTEYDRLCRAAEAGEIIAELEETHAIGGADPAHVALSN